MAEGQVGFKIEFGHSAIKLRQVEERVVAEAAGAAWRIENHSLDSAFRCVEGQAVAGGNQDAAVAGGALFGRNPGESLQQDHVVPDVGIVVGIGGVDQAIVVG